MWQTRQTVRRVSTLSLRSKFNKKFPSGRCLIYRRKFFRLTTSFCQVFFFVANEFFFCCDFWPFHFYSDFYTYPIFFVIKIFWVFFSNFVSNLSNLFWMFWRILRFFSNFYQFLKSAQTFSILFGKLHHCGSRYVWFCKKPLFCEMLFLQSLSKKSQNRKYTSKENEILWKSQQKLLKSRWMSDLLFIKWNKLKKCKCLKNSEKFNFNLKITHKAIIQVVKWSLMWRLWTELKIVQESFVNSANN